MVLLEKCGLCSSPINCALRSQTVVCLKMFLLLEAYRWDCQMLLRDLFFVSHLGEIPEIHFANRKRLVNSCFPGLGRDSSGLLSCIPLGDMSGIAFISHCAIVCCPNHIAVGQRRNCWLIIQHYSPKSHETTKSGLWLMFSVNPVNGPQQITQKSSFYKMKRRLLAQHWESHRWHSVVLEAAGCAGNGLNGGWWRMCHWCGICGTHSGDGHIVYCGHIMAVGTKGWNWPWLGM